MEEMKTSRNGREHQAQCIANKAHQGSTLRSMMRAVLVVTVIITTASGALADRPLTEDEKTKITAAVAAEGCSGGKLEFEDGKFEADDVVCADGKKYDLEFDVSFQLIKKELED